MYRLLFISFLIVLSIDNLHSIDNPDLFSNSQLSYVKDEDNDDRILSNNIKSSSEKEVDVRGNYIRHYGHYSDQSDVLEDSQSVINSSYKRDKKNVVIQEPQEPYDTTEGTNNKIYNEDTSYIKNEKSNLDDNDDLAYIKNETNIIEGNDVFYDDNGSVVDIEDSGIPVKGIPVRYIRQKNNILQNEDYYDYLSEVRAPPGSVSISAYQKGSEPYYYRSRPKKEANARYKKLNSSQLDTGREYINQRNTDRFQDTYRNVQKIKYPDFLIFANDVICRTEEGIDDGMIFYTPHGTYKLRGNIITSPNNTYIISANKVWLDGMVYYFDDQGVYLGDKQYKFKENILSKNGIQYTTSGSIVSTISKNKVNRRCIVSKIG